MSDNDPSWPSDGGTPPGGGSPPSSGGGTPPSSGGGTPPASEDSSPPQSGGGSTPPPPPTPAQPSAPPAEGAGAQTGTAAGLGIRFAARLLDGIMVGIVGAIIVFVLPGSGSFITGLVSALLGIGYYVFLESSQGATFAKQMLNLKVVGADGGHPTIEESAKRNIWMVFGIVPIVGGLAGLAAAIAIAVTISTNDDNRGLHDEFGGTTVAKT